MARKEAHHGGAWKVAYADFVTAMMALFIVLWILAPDNVRKRVVDLADVKGSSSIGGTAGSPGNELKDNRVLRNTPQKGEDNAAPATDFLNMLSNQVVQKIAIPDIKLAEVADVQVKDGQVRVTLFDKGERPMFQKGSAELTPFGETVLGQLGEVVKQHGLEVTLEGHSARGTGDAETAKYGPWELRHS